MKSISLLSIQVIRLVFWITAVNYGATSRLFGSRAPVSSGVKVLACVLASLALGTVTWFFWLDVVASEWIGILDPRVRKVMTDKFVAETLKTRLGQAYWT